MYLYIAKYIIAFRFISKRYIITSKLLMSSSAFAFSILYDQKTILCFKYSMKHKRSSIEYVLEYGYLYKGSLTQNVVVLWASISPSAALLLPSCMKETGIIIGLLIMFFSCFVLFMTQFL